MIVHSALSHKGVYNIFGKGRGDIMAMPTHYHYRPPPRLVTCTSKSNPARHTADPSNGQWFV